MGSLHKLLLPWSGSTIIEHVLNVWLSSRIDRVVLVSRPDDTLLHEVVRHFPNVDLVIPEESPADMKRSVSLGLLHLESETCSDHDRWLMAPADLPTMTPWLIDQVILKSRETNDIVVPKFEQRRGHPVSFPWSLSNQIDQLAAGQGINQLLERFPVQWLQFGADHYPRDVDTQDDYRRLRQAQDAEQGQ